MGDGLWGLVSCGGWVDVWVCVVCATFAFIQPTDDHTAISPSPFSLSHTNTIKTNTQIIDWYSIGSACLCLLSLLAGAAVIYKLARRPTGG